MTLFQWIVIAASVGTIILAWKQYQEITAAKKEIDSLIEAFKSSSLGSVLL